MTNAHPWDHPVSGGGQVFETVGKCFRFSGFPFWSSNGSSSGAIPALWQEIELFLFPNFSTATYTDLFLSRTDSRVGTRYVEIVVSKYGPSNQYSMIVSLNAGGVVAIPITGFTFAWLETFSQAAHAGGGSIDLPSVGTFPYSEYSPPNFSCYLSSLDGTNTSLGKTVFDFDKSTTPQVSGGYNYNVLRQIGYQTIGNGASLSATNLPASTTNMLGPIFHQTGLRLDSGQIITNEYGTDFNNYPLTFSGAIAMPFGLAGSAFQHISDGILLYRIRQNAFAYQGQSFVNFVWTQNTDPSLGFVDGQDVALVKI